jgi:DNA repair protein RadC
VRPHLADKQKEHFMALLLDNRHQLIRLSPIAIGSLSATLVHPREVFKEAIAASAAAVIVAHNHPSGDPTPSEQDVQLTQRLVEAGRVLGIEILDHLIIGSADMVSLRAVGVMTPRTPRAMRGTPTHRRRSG